MILDIMPIPLTQGLYALVDGEDYERINKYKWYATKTPYTYYAIRNAGKRPHRYRVLMHRQILDILKGIETDHINHYGLDNRKYNLRTATKSQNQHNRQRQKGISKYKGVVWNKRAKKWHARIGYNNQQIHLGLFPDEVKAALVYDEKAKELFGEFAHINFEA